MLWMMFYRKPDILTFPTDRLENNYYDFVYKTAPALWFNHVAWFAAFY